MTQFILFKKKYCNGKPLLTNKLYVYGDNDACLLVSSANTTITIVIVVIS
jgi:hypothetical protein